MNPPRGTTHPAPPATAGGAFVFFRRGLTSSYHVPVLADAVRDWTTVGRRIVDATVGGGGHAALFRELGAEVLAVDRDPEAIAAARARLGDSGSSIATPGGLPFVPGRRSTCEWRRDTA
ncbi:MAG: 16S rRNA (cytosine(1402)-N(4))-methyltransferase [Gemmatimonadetes bacterium]|nr:MAG: 16S rRNA (cytosine(1402)-N(4))-methyltransferase [Gemmatimonadota bacterium]